MCWTGSGRGHSPVQDVQRLGTQPAPHQMGLQSGKAGTGIARCCSGDSSIGPWRHLIDCEVCIAQELCHEHRRYPCVGPALCQVLKGVARLQRGDLSSL